MIRFGKSIFSTLVLLMTATALGAEMSAQEFLNYARNPKAASTYGMFYGVLQHRRRNQEPQGMPIYFGVIIRPESTQGQIVVDGREEYVIRQSRASGKDGSSVIYDRKNCVTLDRVGLRATDLTMSFLHYKLVKELSGSMLSAVVSCRVLLLESPDDNPGGKEYVRVYLEKEHAFPLKAEFLKHPDDKKPFRMMEANGFTKKNDLYYARTILVEGPGWRTKVEFDPDYAVLGMYDPKHPVNVFAEIKK